MGSLPDADLRPEYRPDRVIGGFETEVLERLKDVARSRQTDRDVGEQLRRSLTHDRDIVGEQHGFGNIMGNEQDGRAGVALQHLQVVLHHHPCLSVEGAERLVHQDDVGAVHQGPGDSPSFLHAAG
jgi:hypothetical protein